MAHGGALSLQRHYGLIVVCVLQAKHESPRDLDAAQCEAQNDLPVSKTQSPTLAVSLSPVASDRTSGASSKEPGASTSVGALLGWVAPHHLDLQPPSDMSDRAWEPLMEYCQQHSLQPDCDPEPHLGGITSQQDRQDLARLLTAAACLNHAVERMHDDAGWTLVTPGPMRLMYQHHPGCTVHSFRARCELQAPLEHPLCLSREFDLSKTWNKYAVDSLFLKEWSMAEMLCLAVMWFPWPLSNVNMLFSVVGIDLLEEHGCFLTSLHTPSVLPDNVTIPAHLASNPSVDVRQGSFVAMEPLQPAQPGGSPRTRVTMVLHVDPHLTFVPQFIITFVLKVMAPFMHSVVVKLLARIFHDPHSAIAKRLRERASLYDLVRKRCAKHLQQADKQ
ncbi:hypothetical protein QJQ45_008456 [Haematococcus lacustris]|nr:hypothetical protein QJQ45_008456 [Haematococcus lacustris]